MPGTKTILTVYPALLMVSLYLTGRGMADSLDLTPRAAELFWIVAWTIGVPALHLLALRNIRHDTRGYRITATVAAPLILLPFIGLAIGGSVYLVLSYLLFTRGRAPIQDEESE